LSEIDPQKKTKRTHPLVYLIAGEASGDQVGAALIRVLRNKHGANISFQGIGGTAMEKEGFHSLFPMEELSIMGLLEVIPYIPNVYARLQQTFEDIKRRQPSLVLTIDSPGFNFRLAKKVKKLGIPVAHYSAPTVWAWRPNRAKEIPRFLDHLFTLFPFEPPYFTKEGLACTFVGHPLIEKKLDEIDPKPFLKQHNIAKNTPILCVLPGSRQGELKRHLPIFLDTIELLRQNHRDLICVFPTLPSLRDKLEHALHQRGITGVVIVDEEEKYAAMRAATAALAASGTVTLELGLCGTPMVVAYKANPLTAYFVKKLILIKDVSLVNILLKEKVVPELLQEKCTSDFLNQELRPLLSPPSELRCAQIEKLKRLKDLIQPEKGTPSEMVADTVASLTRTRD
jgi:lipid-A-disaccharide synthase